MPKKDRKRLEYFFRVCIIWDEFGYVLLGEKPMAFSGSDMSIHPFKSFREFQYAISPRRMKLANGFKTWKKYEKFFPMTRFVFFYEKDSRDVIFTLVNKNRFIKVVDEYIEDFRTILNRYVTGKELLNEALSGRPLLSKVLENHDVLIGTLLGFGRNNAYLYYQRSKLSPKKIEDFDKECNFGFVWEKEQNNLDQKLDASISWISAYITGSHLKNIELINFPGFMGRCDDSDTLYLKQKYCRTREEIIGQYKDKDFLLATLKILTSEEVAIPLLR